MAHLTVRELQQQPFEPVWMAMKTFTEQRTPDTPDECWLVEHPPVFTQGQAGKPEHLLNPGGIPVVKTDRGGQITYHGPGQTIVYLLIDLKRRGLGVRELVERLEQVVVNLLADYRIPAFANPDAHGVYVTLSDQRIAKIASLGLRVRRGCTYHGVSINRSMNLAPFRQINPCGFQGLAMTQVSDLLPAGQELDKSRFEQALLGHLIQQLGYTGLSFDPALPPDL